MLVRVELLGRFIVQADAHQTAKIAKRKPGLGLEQDGSELAAMSSKGSGVQANSSNRRAIFLIFMFEGVAILVKPA